MEKQTLGLKLERRIIRVGYPIGKFQPHFDDKLHEKAIIHSMNILGDLGDNIKKIYEKADDYLQKSIERIREHDFAKTISISYN